jgi:hypothetical protein
MIKTRMFFCSLFLVPPVIVINNIIVAAAGDSLLPATVVTVFHIPPLSFNKAIHINIS